MPGSPSWSRSWLGVPWYGDSPSPATRLLYGRTPPGPQSNPTSTVVVGTISATQQTAAASDRPCILAAHPIRAAYLNNGGFRAWWSSTGSFASGSDSTDPARPIFRAFDRKFSKSTRPSSAATQWYLIVDLGGTCTFDAGLVLGHNFGGIGGLTVKLEVADSQDFATNLRTIATWTPTTHTARLVNINLGGTQAQYTSCQFVRLNISGASAFQPQVGEFMVSARDQLNDSATLAYDPDQQTGRNSDFDPQSGDRSRYDFNDGRAAPQGAVVLRTSTDWNPVTSWWTNCDNGMSPFGWIERPNSAPNTCLWAFHAKPDRAMPYDSGTVREYAYSLIEQGSPFVSKET